MQQRLPSLLDEPIAFGHRGARAHAPENTLEAFELALRLGANGLESDVWLTADGVPVLDHDGVRAPADRAVPPDRQRRSAVDLPAHIPTLADLIVHCGTDYHLSLDLKDAAAGRGDDRRRRAARPGAAPPAVAVRTRLADAAATCAAAGAELVDSTRLAKIKEGPERRAATLAGEGIDAINMHHTDWNGGLVALFHRFRLCVRLGHAARARPRATACGWASTACYSDWVDRMVDVYTQRARPPDLPTDRQSATTTASRRTAR